MEHIQIKVQKENPKKGAITYHIATVQDIADAVTQENIESFLSDLRMVLNAHLLIKSVNDEMTKFTGVPNKVLTPSFDWIDD